MSSRAVLPLMVATLWAAYALAQPPLPPRVLSPELAADGRVTFRIRAPLAQSARLSGSLPQIPFGDSLEMHKGSEDIWDLTLGPVEPGSYTYAFLLDGVPVVDPAQPDVSLENDNVWSLLHVPGAQFMDTQDVLHGTVAQVRYRSSVLGRYRRMHVYTPPGYGLTRARYPVLYLLHGAGGSDGQWASVGRAADIIDNLIAAGEAAPMIIVMPAGHTGSFTFGPLDEIARGAVGDFVREFQRDIKPYVERHYAVRKERSSTAIAGLSMGGLQTLEIAIQQLRDFGYVGVFSSGVFGVNESDEWQSRYSTELDDASARSGLELMWFSTGEDDFVLPATEGTVAMFREHGFDVTFRRSAGGHTWTNWREYLHQFAPLLFR